MRKRKRLRSCLKINKKHVMIMFVSMNAVNNSYIQRMNAHAQQRICPPIRCKSLYQITYLIMKT